MVTLLSVFCRFLFYLIPDDKVLIGFTAIKWTVCDQDYDV